MDGTIAGLGMAMTLATLKNAVEVTVSRAGTFVPLLKRRLGQQGEIISQGRTASNDTIVPVAKSVYSTMERR